MQRFAQGPPLYLAAPAPLQYYPPPQQQLIDLTSALCIDEQRIHTLEQQLEATNRKVAELVNDDQNIGARLSLMNQVVDNLGCLQDNIAVRENAVNEALELKRELLTRDSWISRVESDVSKLQTELKTTKEQLDQRTLERENADRVANSKSKLCYKQNEELAEMRKRVTTLEEQLCSFTIQQDKNPPPYEQDQSGWRPKGTRIKSTQKFGEKPAFGVGYANEDNNNEKPKFGFAPHN